LLKHPRELDEVSICNMINASCNVTSENHANGTSGNAANGDPNLIINSRIPRLNLKNSSLCTWNRLNSLNKISVRAQLRTINLGIFHHLIHSLYPRFQFLFRIKIIVPIMTLCISSMDSNE
jgi:hypothetical protein